MNLQDLSFSELMAMREDLSRLVRHELSYEDRTLESPEVKIWEDRLKKVRAEIMRRLETI